MRTCNEIFTQGECAGHLSKFEDCRAEALDMMSLDFAEDFTGATDFEGHVMLFLFDTSETFDMSEGDEAPRIINVPAGNYILHYASGGAVSLWKYDTREAAIAEYTAYEDRYAAWEDDEEI